MKWYTYLICFILIIVGSFCGMRLYTEIKAESYVNGSIDISNKFVQESFYYYNSSVVFYHDAYDETETYSFEKELLKVEDFNGNEKQYKVELNNFVILNPDINAGSVFSQLNMDFYNTDGNVVCKGTLDISIKFLSNKTTLTLTTKSNEQASFFEQYFVDNGIRLKVIEIL